MWIKNDIKTEIVKSENFILNITDTNAFRIMALVNDTLIQIGVYSTEQKAKKVLQTIWNKVINNESFYEIPLDEEVGE